MVQIRIVPFSLHEIFAAYILSQMFEGFICDCVSFVGKAAVKRIQSQHEGVEDEAQQVVKARTRVILSPRS